MSLSREVGKSRCNKEFNRKRATVTVVIIGHQPKQYTIKRKFHKFTIHLHCLIPPEKGPIWGHPCFQAISANHTAMGEAYFLLHIYRASPVKPTEQSNLQNDLVPFDLFFELHSGKLT